MAKVDISEFSFGFAVVHELINLFPDGLVGAPMFPSLRKEAELGYDAKIPVLWCTMFFQFKIPELVTQRSRSRFRMYSPGTQYLRMSLHPRAENRQHRALKSLAAKYQHTYYVAPDGLQLTLFDASFLGNQVLATLAFIPVASCPSALDRCQHYITWVPNGTTGWFHSKPKEVKVSRWDNLFTSSGIKPTPLYNVVSELQREADEVYKCWLGATGDPTSETRSSNVVEPFARHYNSEDGMSSCMANLLKVSQKLQAMGVLLALTVRRG